LKLLGTIRAERYASRVSDAALRETPGSQYAGGHRIRVTPVPIPNTEVKPDTADGTARETAWESRSLPAVNKQTKTPDVLKRVGRFCLYAYCGLGIEDCGFIGGLWIDW
jgi:hypothetical protein